MSMNCFAYELYWNVLSRNMNPIATQQAPLDNALVLSKKILKIERCNARIAFSKPQREETYQVTLEALKLSPCYPEFVITAEVPQIYMHQFWNTITKIKDTDAYSFNLDKKKCQVDTEVFREIIHIYLRILNQDFIALPSEDDLVTFIQELGYSGRCNMLSAIHTNQMHQAWRTFSTIINRFMYQADNREISSARKEHMPYLRFTKVIINHFISKDKTISMRNMINLHTIRDDSLLGTLKFVSKTQDYQQYRAPIPDDMINQDIKDSKAYKTYYDFATGKVPPKKARKYKKVSSPSKKLFIVKEAEPIKKGKRVKRPAKKSTTAPTASVVIKDTLGVSVSKKKAPAKVNRIKVIEILYDVALSEVAQLKETIKRSKKDCHISQASGLGVLDVPTYDSESENKSWGDSEDDNDDDNKGDDDMADSDDDGNSDSDDNERTDSDDDDENPSFTLKDYYKEEHDEEYKSDDDGNSDSDENERTDSDDDDENPSFTLKDYYKEEHDEEYKSDDDYEHVFEEEDVDLYKDVDVRSLGAKHKKEREGDEVMTDAGQNSKRIRYATRIALESYVKDFEKKAQEERKLYIDVVEKSVKYIIKDEVKSLLPQILPKEVSDFATPVIQKFKLKKIFLDKIERSESFKTVPGHKELYEGLVKSYNLNKDLFSSYKNVYSLKRDRDDKDKDEDPSARSDRGLKKRKTNKDAEPPKGLKSKESKTNSSKGTKSQLKSSSKSVQANEPVFETADTEMPQDQGGDQKDQPNIEATLMDDWFKKSNKPSTIDLHWNDGKSIDSRPSQKLISNIAKGKQPPRTNLKGFVELEYHFKECYKVVTDQLDWNNLKGHEYPFDLNKPLPLIEAQGHQVFPADYFFNNDLEYLKGGSSSRMYTTSTTKTKAVKYDNIEGIEDMRLEL
nr:hypothetical protein [Tanacetum cinerariifolium]